MKTITPALAGKTLVFRGGGEQRGVRERRFIGRQAEDSLDEGRVDQSYLDNNTPGNKRATVGDSCSCRRKKQHTARTLVKERAKQCRLIPNLVQLVP